MLVYVRLVLLCALVYLALTANVELSNIGVGVIIGISIAVMLRPKPEPLSLSRLPFVLINLARYVVWLSVDIIRNGIRVARIVLDPKLPIRPGIIAVPSSMKTELGVALNAHAITVTPGEQVVEIGEDGTLYVHCLDVDSSLAGMEHAQRLRKEMLSRIFE
ncbi:MAG: Na+/H+ antiporter subunit E [Thermoflexales bacterium]